MGQFDDVIHASHTRQHLLSALGDVVDFGQLFDMSSYSFWGHDAGCLPQGALCIPQPEERLTGRANGGR